ncbi:MAG TPA: DUF4129 domain-containing protein [Chitinophagaceae bacterium]|nr:DUF4129 domain-containing protein [Chitinophagaceae bacterium]
MKARKLTITFRALLACLLLLLQGNAMAQEEEVVEAVTDTAYVTDAQADETSDDAAEEEEVKDTAVYRQVPDSVIVKYKNNKDFAYANDPQYWVRKKPEKPSESWLDRLLSQPWLKYVILALMALILLYAIVKIAVSNKLLLFRSAPMKADIEAEQDLLKQENLPALITQAEQAGSLRLAVRYRYMKTLQDMQQRNLIQLSAQATNWEYVNRLGSHPLRKQFQLLTRAYEYVWYGEFDVNAEQYGYLKTEFQKFESSI